MALLDGAAPDIGIPVLPSQGKRANPALATNMPPPDSETPLREPDILRTILGMRRILECLLMT
jgi:hypothetical protein